MMFADDTTVFIKDKNIDTLFNKGNNDLNKFLINISKTKSVLFYCKHSNTQDTNLNVLLRSNKIQQVSSFIFFVYMDLIVETINYFCFLRLVEVRAFKMLIVFLPLVW